MNFNKKIFTSVINNLTSQCSLIQHYITTVSANVSRDRYDVALSQYHLLKEQVNLVQSIIFEFENSEKLAREKELTDKAD